MFYTLFMFKYYSSTWIEKENLKLLCINGVYFLVVIFAAKEVAHILQKPLFSNKPPVYTRVNIA